MPMRREYRAASVAVLASWLARHSDEETRWRLVAEFLEEYRHEPPVTRLALLAAEPSSVLGRGQHLVRSGVGRSR